jgi:hypothetical protein
VLRGSECEYTLFCIHVHLLSGSLFSAVRGKNIGVYEPVKKDNEGTVIHTFFKWCTLMKCTSSR